MSPETHEFHESVSFFHRACEAPYLCANEVNRINHELGLRAEVPTALVGLAWEFVSDEPQYYWSHDAAEEVCLRLSELDARDSSKLSSALSSAQEHIFAGINSYHSAISVERELSDISYEESLKTKIFRNPLYVQLCEDCLMNLYRGLRCVVAAFRTEKDYSEQDTLGKILPVLKSNGFSVACEVDSDIRNAINHGNTTSTGSDVLFKYKSGNGHTVRKMRSWQYQELIDGTMDLAGGMIVGLVRFFADHPDLIDALFASGDEDCRFQWLSLYLRAPRMRLLFIEHEKFGSPQLNITAETSIENEDWLFFALVQIIRAAHVVFPNYERYLVGYHHNRSPIGFIRLTSEDLARSHDTPDLLKAALQAGEFCRLPIQQDEVDERAYRFHVFPSLRSRDWVIRGVEDCSIDGYKRIKARLVLARVETRETIRRFLKDAFPQLRELRTPKNPYEAVPFGETEADIVFIDVFIRPRDRKGFTLFPNNRHFVCMAFYYATENAPRLEHGGIPESLWNGLEHESSGEISVAWNPHAMS